MSLFLLYHREFYPSWHQLAGFLFVHLEPKLRLISSPSSPGRILTPVEYTQWNLEEKKTLTSMMVVFMLFMGERHAFDGSKQKQWYGIFFHSSLFHSTLCSLILTCLFNSFPAPIAFWTHSSKVHSWPFTSSNWSVCSQNAQFLLTATASTVV